VGNIISSMGELTSYVTLALLIIGLFVIRSRKITAVLLAIEIFLGFVYEILNPIGLFAIASFWGICTLHWRHLSSKEWVNTLRMVFIAAIAIAFAAHMIPGFDNRLVFDAILISPYAAPFTMYLNFDKTVAAAVLAVASGLLLKQTIPFGRQSWRNTFVISALCISFLLSLDSVVRR
jgi:hypothetical protein